MFQKPCVRCGTMFSYGIGKNSLAYCSDECRKKNQKKLRQKRYMRDYVPAKQYPMTCVVCGVETTGYKHSKTCGDPMCQRRLRARWRKKSSA